MLIIDLFNTFTCFPIVYILFHLHSVFIAVVYTYNFFFVNILPFAHIIYILIHVCLTIIIIYIFNTCPCIRIVYIFILPAFIDIFFYKRWSKHYNCLHIVYIILYLCNISISNIVNYLVAAPLFSSRVLVKLLLEVYNFTKTFRSFHCIKMALVQDLL